MNPLQTGIEEILAELKRRTSRGFSDDEVRALLTRLVRYTLVQAASECKNQHLAVKGAASWAGNGKYLFARQFVFHRKRIPNDFRAKCAKWDKSYGARRS